MKKKITLILGILFILLSTPAFAATSHTRDEALSWLNSQVGKSIDYDGVSGVQCVDLAKAYYAYLGVSPVKGNGKDYATNALPSGWKRYTSGTSPQPGDIGYYTTGGGGYGHVFIILSVNGSNNIGLHQNWGSKPCQKVTQQNSKLSGIIRPDWKTTTVNDRDKVGSPIGGGSQVLSDGDYHIVSALNQNKGVDVNEAKTANGTNIQLWNNIDYSTQVFTVKWLGNGFYSIRQRSSGKSLDVHGSGRNWGTNVELYTYNETSNQQWVIRQTNNPQYFQIVSRCNGLALDVNGGSDANGTNIQVWGSHNENSQKWKFIAAGDNVGKTLSDGNYEIVSALDNSKCLDVVGNGSANNTNVDLWTRHHGNNQRWKVKYLGSGYYTITSLASGKNLDMYENRQVAGTNIGIYSVNNANSQQWILKSAGNGYYYIIHKGSGLYLDINGGQNKDGANIQGWTAHYGNNQKWKFESIGSSAGLESTEIPEEISPEDTVEVQEDEQIITEEVSEVITENIEE